MKYSPRKVTYKRLLLAPLFLLNVFAGFVLVVWGGTSIYQELAAQRDIAAFVKGQYSPAFWLEFTSQNPILTQQDLIVRFYNRAMVKVAQASQTDDVYVQTNLYALAVVDFQEALNIAEERNDVVIAAKSASALGAVLLRVALAEENAVYLEKAESFLVRALVLNPKDDNARWNLEFLRRLYREADDSQGQGNEDGPVGPGGINPSEGGL